MAQAIHGILPIWQSGAQPGGTIRCRWLSKRPPQGRSANLPVLAAAGIIRLAGVTRPTRDREMGHTTARPVDPRIDRL
ncbi:MAG: hypothetical protein FD138_1131 [Planctomycetota bacterium]|nr:MAG: hypothetical protein FD138_1131 [Planctomycetota bacterium]